MIDLLVADTTDEVTQENMQRIADFVRENPFMNANAIVREIVFNKAETNFRYPHGLNFTPKDIVLLSTIGAGALTINYSLITDTHLDFTTSGVCTVRLLIGILGVT